MIPENKLFSQNDLMVAQSEVEKLREELTRVRSEGTGNLFGENQVKVGHALVISDGCVVIHMDGILGSVGLSDALF